MEQESLKKSNDSHELDRPLIVWFQLHTQGLKEEWSLQVF